MSDGHKVGCSGKRQFAKFCQAARAAKHRNRTDGDAHLEAYHCKHCQGFHVGEARDYGHRDRRKEQTT